MSTSAAPTATAAPVVAAAGTGLKFPGKSLDVRFTAYDFTTNFASFYVTRTEPTGGGPHVADVPGLHRLPLAPAARITSSDPGGFPFETCPPQNCTPGHELEAVLGHHAPGGLFARMDVDVSDQITAIAESAY
ncbi:hypothetical protein [Amycolatopsis sp. FDAARGOS 1241]|uniref:hypothetical protein n=1 Tax=Amycolatopsis sp. FDAARGOS 1241 TaxID=2778070 RepID=UPI0019524ABD|nr:hypothetical protein [Amycolatopsis sp. FDAARGOS 1241]QRP43327.1 hypothetical protein I6J71_28390 [Amycolatopsis sp. FDAARGOS 1241]